MSAPIPIRWDDDGASLVILDQTELPEQRVERHLRSVEDVFEAIQHLRVRGAPLIGITAAMGVAALACQAARAGQAPAKVRDDVHRWCRRLSEARPTAVNLAWALERMVRVAGPPVPVPASPPARDAAPLAQRLTDEADRIRTEDREMCTRMGRHVLDLLGEGRRVLTHCNTGALATGGVGTAVAAVYLAAERERPLEVFATETRPLLQGSRLTAWELSQAGIDVTLITDGMVAALMQDVALDAVLVGADRIAANGDTANKIGTYGLAVAARHHGVPLYVVAPTSTLDADAATGDDIAIEHRPPDEVRRGFGRATAPPECAVWNPAFDVTPATLITAIVTEHGVARAPFERPLAKAREAAGAARSGVRITE